MRVEIEKAGQDIFIVPQVDDPSGAEVVAAEARVHLKEFAVTHQNASVPTNISWIESNSQPPRK